MIAAAAMVTRVPWQRGVAQVVAVKGPTATVACPHCGGQHQHPRNFVGSRQVVAGCHTGFTRCREYAIVQVRGRSGFRR